MLGKAVVQDAAHAAGRKRQNLILQELFEIDGLAAVLIRDDDDVVLADDPFADIRMLDVSRYEGEVAAVTQHPFHQPVGTEGGIVFNLNRDLRKRFVKIENGKVTNYFQFRNSPLSHHHALTASSCPLRCPCFPC